MGAVVRTKKSALFCGGKKIEEKDTNFSNEEWGYRPRDRFGGPGHDREDADDAGDGAAVASKLQRGLVPRALICEPP